MNSRFGRFWIEKQAEDAEQQRRLHDLLHSIEEFCSRETRTVQFRKPERRHPHRNKEANYLCAFQEKRVDGRGGYLKLSRANDASRDLGNLHISFRQHHGKLITRSCCLCLDTLIHSILLAGFN
jgi:hypothetical protein